LFGNDLKKTKLVSISPLTTETLRSCTHEPAAEATTYTGDGVIDAILEKVAGPRGMA
jgi:uroporphyrinogen-III synthase